MITMEKTRVMENSSIRVVKDISAGHILDDVEKCGRMHGHNYRIEIEIMGEVQSDGMILNFDRVKDVVMQYDHKFIASKKQVISSSGGKLNGTYELLCNHKNYTMRKDEVEVLSADFSSAENFAKEIAYQLNTSKGVRGVTVIVEETPNNKAVFSVMNIGGSDGEPIW